MISGQLFNGTCLLVRRFVSKEVILLKLLLWLFFPLLHRPQRLEFLTLFRRALFLLLVSCIHDDIFVFWLVHGKRFLLDLSSHWSGMLLSGWFD